METAHYRNIYIGTAHYRNIIIWKQPIIEDYIMEKQPIIKTLYM